MKLLKNKQLINAKILLFSGMLTFFIIGVASLCQAQKVPKEVQKMIDLYTKDPTINFGFNDAKEWAFVLDQNIKFSDIEVGVPVGEYCFEYDSLEKYDDTVSIKSVIESTNVWYLPILAHGEFLYDVGIYNNNGISKMVEMGTGISYLWQDKEIVKQSSLWGYSILIKAGSRKYIHFPQKDAHNLLDAKPFHDDSLGLSPSQLKNAFNDSKKILSYHKKEGIENKANREKYIKMRDEKLKETQKQNFGGVK